MNDIKLTNFLKNETKFQGRSPRTYAMFTVLNDRKSAQPLSTSQQTCVGSPAGYADPCQAPIHGLLHAVYVEQRRDQSEISRQYYLLSPQVITCCHCITPHTPPWYKVDKSVCELRSLRINVRQFPTHFYPSAFFCFLAAAAPVHVTPTWTRRDRLGAWTSGSLTSSAGGNMAAHEQAWESSAVSNLRWLAYGPSVKCAAVPLSGQRQRGKGVVRLGRIWENNHYLIESVIIYINL